MLAVMAQRLPDPPVTPPVSCHERWATAYAEMRHSSLATTLEAALPLGPDDTAVRAFVALHDTENAGHEFGTTTLYAALIDAVATIPMPLSDAGIQMMELHMAMLAHHREIPGYEKMGTARWLLVKKRTPCGQNVPRDAHYTWCTVFAHLWTVADAIAEKKFAVAQTQSKMSEEATFVCARFLGDNFTTFCYAVMSLHLLTGVLPQPLRDCIQVYIDLISSPAYNGRVPPWFIQPNI